MGDADATLQHLLSREASAGHDVREAPPAAAGSGSAGCMGFDAAIDEALDRCAAELGVPAEKVHMPHANESAHALPVLQRHPCRSLKHTYLICGKQ